VGVWESDGGHVEEEKVTRGVMIEWQDSGIDWGKSYTPIDNVFFGYFANDLERICVSKIEEAAGIFTVFVPDDYQWNQSASCFSLGEAKAEAERLVLIEAL
jgi:hypothetical protein